MPALFLPKKSCNAKRCFVKEATFCVVDAFMNAQDDCVRIFTYALVGWELLALFRSHSNRGDVLVGETFRLPQGVSQGFGGCTQSHPVGRGLLTPLHSHPNRGDVLCRGDVSSPARGFSRVWRMHPIAPCRAGACSRRFIRTTYAPLAQLVEQLTLNQRAQGSSP